MARRLLLTFVLALLAAPAAAGAEVRWLCHPGLPGDPCRGDQTTTYEEPDRSSRVATPPGAGPAPPVDCFYVYPTTSNQPTPTATKSADPEIRSIALYQAQRFSLRCRVFVPLYRQATAAAVALASQTRDGSIFDTGYADVREAFAQYLRDDNGGRGFVLLGHSQGGRVLRALIRADVDPVPAVRARLLSAIIPGANHVVRAGSNVGGDFAAIPLCERLGQIGCSLSWHTYDATPPANARYGRTDADPVGSALGLPRGPGFDVACTDPVALAGAGSQPLLPSEPFAPGVIATLLVRLYNGPPPRAATPWLSPGDRYTGGCTRAGGAHVLLVRPTAGSRDLTPSPDPSWGLHLVDINLVLGSLVRIVAAQSAAYAAQRGSGAGEVAAGRAQTGATGFERAGRRLVRVLLRDRGRSGHSGVRRLLGVVTGEPRARVPVTLRLRGRVIARRTVRLGPGGNGFASFRVTRPGLYRFVAVDGSRRTAAQLRLRRPRR